MKTLTQLFSPDLVDALGWTLLHSLWQGALVAVLLSVLLVAMRSSSSQARYLASGGALLLLVCLVAGTFIWLYAPVTNIASVNQAVGAQWPQKWPTEVVIQQAVPVADSMLNSITGFFSAQLPLLVLAWALGAMIMLLRMLGGLVLVQRMRSHKLVAAPAAWLMRVNELRQMAGINRTVQLAESALVKVPLTIGLLKPVILLPIGTLAGIPASQIEAILAHELAHIGRKDFLFNLLQSMVEVLFFYHPAVWYISNSIRTEREHCCDDMAIRLCGDSYTFASALASIEEFTLQPPAMAMAFGRKKGSLLNRVKRLLGQHQEKADFGEGFWSGCVVAAVLLATVLALLVAKPAANAVAAIPGNADSSWLPGGNLASAAPDAPESPTPEAQFAPQLAAENNDLTATTLTLTDTSGKSSNLIIIKNKKGKITELYVDGRKVSKDAIPEYSAQINSALADQKANAKTKHKALSKAEEKARIEKHLAKSKGKKKNTYTYHYNSADDNFDFDFDFDFNDYGSFQLTPLAPMPPMPPMVPMAAFGKDADARREYEKEMKAYEKQMQEYKRQMEAYEREMKEFEKEMEKLGPEIEKQVKESMKASGVKKNR